MVDTLGDSVENNEIKGMGQNQKTDKGEVKGDYLIINRIRNFLRPMKMKMNSKREMNSKRDGLLPCACTNVILMDKVVKPFRYHPTTSNNIQHHPTMPPNMGGQTSATFTPNKTMLAICWATLFGWFGQGFTHQRLKIFSCSLSRVQKIQGCESEESSSCLS